MWGDLMKPITRKEKLIAGEKLTPITREEMFLKQYGGGGASSWNDLTDRPFYEEIQTIEPIIWDGNTEGLVEVTLWNDVYDEGYDKGAYYKVSDKVFTNEQMKMMSIVCYDSDEDSEYVDVNIGEIWDDLVEQGNVSDELVRANGVVVVRKEGATNEDLVFPEVGVYFQKEERLEETPGDGYDWKTYVSSFPSEAVNETTIKKIDDKYLPESNVFTVVVTNHGDEELTIDKSFEDAMLAAKSGKYIDAKYVFANSSGSFEYGQFYAVSFTPDNYDVPCFEVSDSYGDKFYWTSDGITTEAPSGGR